MSHTDNAAIELKVRQIVADSLCQDLADVELKSNLMRDLGAESIDFLDIMFRLEKDFQIKIPQREIEQMARGGLPAEEFEKENVIQPKGLERLKQMLPEVDAAEWREGMTLMELPTVFTVEVFCNIVKRKLAGQSLLLPADAQQGANEGNKTQAV